MPRRLSEEATRKQMIDPQLENAAWFFRDYSRVKTEIPVDGYDAEPWNGISDYTLYRENGEVLAVRVNDHVIARRAFFPMKQSPNAGGDCFATCARNDMLARDHLLPGSGQDDQLCTCTKRCQHAGQHRWTDA